VKVRFTDGGYKRYKTAEFNSLVTQAKYSPAMPEEWSHHRSDSIDNRDDEMKKLHEDIMDAVQRGDFALADTHQKKFKQLSAKYDEIHMLEVKLTDAVNRGDFVKAHEIQGQLKQLKGASADVITPATATGPAKSAGSASDILKTAANKALSGGLAGMSAMVLQVSTLMWMRTLMNYQYRYGGTTVEAAKILYAEGGIPRFYRGIAPALIQGPISRFGDTAANAGVLSLFESNESVRNWPAFAKTMFSSACAASMRIALVPVDTVKTMMQVEGKEGLAKLGAKFKAGGVPVLFHGALATSAATFVGHYPWFTVFNTLNDLIPKYTETPRSLGATQQSASAPRSHLILSLTRFAW